MNTDDFVKASAICKNNILLFSFENAIKLIELCEFEGRRILGIDTFLIYTNGSIQPILEESIDFTTAHKDYEGYWEEARRFILSKKEVFYYDIVYE